MSESQGNNEAAKAPDPYESSFGQEYAPEAQPVVDYEPPATDPVANYGVPIQPQGYGQQAYAPPQPYAQPQPYGSPQPYAQPYGGYYQPRPEHPQSQTVMILGLVSLAVGLTGPIAWYMGSKIKKEIRQGAPYDFGNGNIGYIIGIITSVGMGLFVLFYVLLFLWVFAMSSGMSY